MQGAGGAARFASPQASGILGSSSREFSSRVFLPSTVSHRGQARLFRCPVLNGTCGPEAWAASVPSHDKISCHSFLISHLLQCRLGLKKDFFRSLVLLILFSMMLYFSPFGGGEEFCAHCLDWGNRNLRQGLGLAWGPSLLFLCSGLWPPPPTSP